MKFPALRAERLKEKISDSSMEEDLGRNVLQNSGSTFVKNIILWLRQLLFYGSHHETG
jgi:hypothetical protein